MKKDKNNLEIDLNKYKDPSGLSLDKLNFGLWFSENRKKITKIIIICLICISAFFFLYSTYNYLIYFFSGSKIDEDTMIVSSPKNNVADLIIGTPYVLKSNDSYDIISTISNPNTKFFASFKYCFNNEAGEISCGSNFILPGEDKYISALGQKINNGVDTVSFKIKEISWQRIDTHKIIDWPSFSSEHLKFTIKNINLNLDSDDNLNLKKGLDSLEFTINNKSNFSYYEVPLDIVFYRDSEIVGANKTVVKNFLAGESRTINISWPAMLSGVNRTDIRPELNLLNDGIYLKYQGNQSNN